jgi:hypothetical protein
MRKPSQTSSKRESGTSMETNCGRFASMNVPSPATATPAAATPAALICRNFRRVGNRLGNNDKPGTFSLTLFYKRLCDSIGEAGPGPDLRSDNANALGNHCCATMRATKSTTWLNFWQIAISVRYFDTTRQSEKDLPQNSLSVCNPDVFPFVKCRLKNV